MADPTHPLTSAAPPAGAGPVRSPGAALEGTRAGPDDFAAFFTSNRDAIHRFLHRLARNDADADDLVQETFLAAWRKRAQFDGRGSAGGWLRRTAFRTYLNHAEKLRRRRALDAGNPAPRPGPAQGADHAVADDEARAFLLRRIEEAVAGLPDGPREAFVLFRFEGLTVAQIADATETPAKTVETRIRRATGLLAEKVRRFRDSVPGR